MRNITGGFRLPAFLYAILNEANFAAIIPALIATFFESLNRAFWIIGGNGRILELARYSYPAFVVHPRVSLVIELCLDGVMSCALADAAAQPRVFSSFGMTVCLGVLNTVASCAMPFTLVECMPFVGSII